MRIVTLFILCLATSVFGATNDLRQVIKAEAGRCALGLLARNYEVVIEYTHPKVVALVGGKERMIETLRRGTDEMSAQGTTFEKATIGEPEEPRTSGGIMYALVPETITLKVPGGKSTAESVLVAVSNDGGKKWVFVDGESMTPENMKLVLPELVGKISIPPPKPAVFVKDKAPAK